MFSVCTVFFLEGTSSSFFIHRFSGHTIKHMFKFIVYTIERISMAPNYSLEAGGVERNFTFNICIKIVFGRQVFGISRSNSAGNWR